MNDTPESPQEKSQENAGFESLKKVEFAGDKQLENSQSPEVEEHSNEMTLEEKIAKLREPFQADEAARLAHEDKLILWHAESDTRSEDIDSISKEIEELKSKNKSILDEIKEKQDSFSSRLKSRLGLRNKTVEELASRRRAIQEKVGELYERKENIGNDSKFAEADLDDLHEESEIVENPEPLTIEQKEQLLAPEALSELSLEEYIALWRRLNPFYVSHVTRQGVRDHNFMIYHSAGMGQFHSGFTNMLEQGKSLHSAGEVHYGLSERFTEEDVKHALEIAMPNFQEDIDEYLENGADPENVAGWFVNHLRMNASSASAEPWSDLNAIHFGRNTCLDDIYGAENGNEVFYIFPIDVIASQNRFGGHVGRNFSTAQVKSERKANDLFVWSETGHIQLDSGIVFLPKSAPVSPETGSIYETVKSVGEKGETKREPFLDEEIVQSLIKTIETLNQEGFYNPENDSFYSIIDNRERRDALRERLKNEFYLTDEIIDRILEGDGDLLKSPKGYAEDILFISRAKTDGFDLDSMSQEEKFRLSIRYGLERRSLGFKKAEATISSEEYWRKYFEEHPEQTPKHIVFYDGNPSEAVDEFLIEHKIAERIDSRSDTSPNLTGPGDTHEQDGDWLGYDDHFVRDPRKDERFIAEHARFNEIAKRYALEMIRDRKRQLDENRAESQ